MKKIFAFVALMFTAVNANAVVLDFDDINVGVEAYLNTAAGPNYGGLSWSNTWGVLNTTSAAYSNSGYANGVTSGTNVAFNAFYQNVSIDSGTMDWNGAYFAGAWNDGLTINFIGSQAGVELYNETITVDTSGSIWFDANFIGIDNLVISSSGGTANATLSAYGSGQHFSMDDFTFNANVPETSSLILLGLGLIGFGVARRKA